MKLQSTIGKLFLAAAICAAIPTAPAQELLTNGGFETGDFTGWSLIDTSGFSGVDDDPAFAFQSMHYAFLGAEGTIGSLSQQINTIPGQTYTFSFQLANDITPPAGGNFFQALFGSQTVLSLNDLGVQDYQPYSFQIVATDAQTTIQFQYSHGDDFFRLDAVSVVPEPSSIALFGMAAVGGLVAMRRRARRNLTSRE